MRLKVKTLRGQQFLLDAEPSDCVFDLKNRIKQQKGITVDKQKLVYKGKVMDEKAILSQMGVKDEDNIVLMNFIAKKEEDKKQIKPVEENKKIQKKNSIKQKKQKKDEPKIDEKSIEKLVKLGYDRKKAEQALKKTDNNLENAIEELLAQKKAEGKQISPNQILKHEILKSLVGNTQHLAANPSGQLTFTGDLSHIQGLLEKNQELQKLVLQNPDALNELLLNDQYGDGQQDEDYPEDPFQDQQDQQYLVDIQFTAQQEQAIQRLVDLGFERENVIQAYLACERNQEMAADMLFRQKQNGDFE